MQATLQSTVNPVVPTPASSTQVPVHPRIILFSLHVLALNEVLNGALDLARVGVEEADLSQHFTHQRRVTHTLSRLHDAHHSSLDGNLPRLIDHLLGALGFQRWHGHVDALRRLKRVGV